jgi:predicted MFS family arabinose efflux permease
MRSRSRVSSTNATADHARVPVPPAPRRRGDVHRPDQRGGGPGSDLPLLPLLVLAAVGFVSVTTELLPAGLLPEIGAAFGVSESATGLLTAGYAAIIVVSVIPIMTLTARLPRRMLMLAGLAAFVTGNLLLAASPTFAVAVVARLVAGVAHGTVWALMAPYVARIVPDGKAGRGMAIVFAGNSVGAAAGAPLGTVLGEGLGWRAAFVALAITVAGLTLLVAVLVPRAPGVDRSASRSVITAVRRPGVAAITVASPLLLLAHFAMLTYIAPFLEHVRLPDAATSFGLSLLGVAGLAGIWLAGVTVDSIPRRSLVRATVALVLAFVALGVSGSGVIVTLALVAIWGAAFSATAVYNQAALLSAAGPLKDAATSLIVVATQLGIALGAVYGGLALDVTGVRAVPFAAAVPAAVALVIVVLVRRTAYPPGPGERDDAGARPDADRREAAEPTGPAVHRAPRHRSASPSPAPARSR